MILWDVVWAGHTYSSPGRTFFRLWGAPFAPEGAARFARLTRRLAEEPS